MKELGDAALVTETDDDIRWRTDILVAIEREQWEDAQLLLLARQVRTANALTHLRQERDSLLDAWRSQLHGLPEQDYHELLRGMERMTFGYIKSGLIKLYLPSLRKFLTLFRGILVKIVAAFLFAAVAALAHHMIGAQIGRAFDGWFRQYVALVVFILAYRTIEKPLEGALDRLAAGIHQWGLRAEGLGAYIDGIEVRQWEAELARLRASLTKGNR